MIQELRWKQRFSNLLKARSRLCRVVEFFIKNPEDDILITALIGTFMFTFELSWKTLRDYLNYKGIDASLPRDVIKHAFQHQLIKNGHAWIEMLDNRNQMAHTYDADKAKAVCNLIINSYLQPMEEAYDFFKAHLDD